MYERKNISDRVVAAQHNIDEADNLIRDYFPFIKSETAKTIGRIPVEGKDDELSIALMGFYEAIENYDNDKGSFLNFASLIIKRRIIDFLRQENSFKNHLSWEESAGFKESNKALQVSDDESIVDRTALKWEIGQLKDELRRLDISMSDVATNCPKYDKVVDSCRKVIDYIIGQPDLMETMIETGKLPVSQIIEKTSVKKKTLEKHRKYLMALAVIYFRKYDCLINHLTEVFKTEKGGKCR